MNDLKVIVCGDVKGEIDQLFTRIKKLEKKGQYFDLLLCVGDFFGDVNTGWNDYKQGNKDVPIQTYILGPNNTKYNHLFEDGSIDGFEICNNITYLGKKGVFTTSSGLQIAYISGLEGEKSTMNTFNSEDSEFLMNLMKVKNPQFTGIDILLTTQWPKNVTKYANETPTRSADSLILSKFVKESKPRYHFAAGEDLFYERLPFRNHLVLKEQSKHVTRFLSLAAINNKKKQKYLYAFNITPLVKMSTADLIKQPETTTENPFNEIVEETNTIPVITSNQFRWQANTGEKRKNPNYPNNGIERKASRPQNWSCWFCLGGDKVEKHLVTSVGSLCYVAAAKGQLLPGHMLICPIAHHGSSLELPEDTAEELNKFKKALSAAFATNGQHCVIYERNYKSDHLQIQVVPVPQAITSNAIKQSILDCASAQVDRQGRPIQIDFAELPEKAELKQLVSAGVPFFHLELPDGQRLFHRIKKYFPLQFGREAMSVQTVLNIPQRVDWRSCILSRSEEENSTKVFRKFFHKFDFTLEDDSDDDVSD